MRPHQWYKNLVVFIGLIFSHNLLNFELWPLPIFAFMMFCLISGSMYIINDIVDVDKDRLHPKKKYRPIALGIIPIRIGLFISIFILIFCLIISFYVNVYLTYIEVIYIILNLLYDFYLKYYALLDVMMVAFGFILRAIAGVLIINASISPWLILCIFMMALVLVFGKRRHELLVAKDSKDVLCQYTVEMIENMMNISVSLLLMSYAIYSFFINVYIMITLPFAAYGIFRYVQLVYLKDFGGEGELIFKDRASLINLACWTLCVIIILYWIPV
jgi:4-hydroxybenzoate polyprenyltransferase